MRRSLSTVMSAARVRGVVAAASYQVHARGLSIAPASQSSGRQPKKTGPSVLEMFEEASRSKKEAKLAISQSEGFHPEVSATNPAKPKTELENFHDSLEQGDFAKIKKHLASPNIPKSI